MAQQKANSVQFAKRILELTKASWVEGSDFDEFVEMAGVQPGQQKVDFCQRFLALIKRLPDKLIDAEAKQKIIEAGQEYLDQAIEEEEELLDE